MRTPKLHIKAGLENSTRPLVFTSASGCRASENYDIISENQIISHLCQEFLWCRASAYFQIFRGLQRRTADFWKFISTAENGYRDVLSAEKNRPHLPDYVIYVPPSYWKLIYLFIDHARTSHLTDFESFIDSQCHV